MALIQCPVCGKSISENAVACPNCGEPMNNAKESNQVLERGTEHFVVTGGNRFELAAKTNSQIQEATAMLQKQGKIVTNVHATDPQPFKMIFTYWQNNITLTWERRR